MEDDRNNRQNRLGFTLVELVVVIAILGILAGVAYAGYGGYLEYAKRAGDEEIISAVNLAFTTACEEQGIDRATLRYKGASLDYDVNKIKGLRSVEVSDEGTFKALFDNYFKDNEGKELQVYTSDDIIFVGGSDLFSYAGNIDQEHLRKELGRLVEDSNLASDTEQVGKALNSTKTLAEKVLGAIKGMGMGMDKKIDEMLIQFAKSLQEKGFNFSVDSFDDIAQLSPELQNEIINATILQTASDLSKSDANSLLETFKGLDYSELNSNMTPGEIRGKLIGMAFKYMDNPDQLVSGLALSAGMTSAYYNYCKNNPDKQDWCTRYENSMNDTSGSRRMAAFMQCVTEMQADADYMNDCAQNDMNGLIGTFTAADLNSDSYDISDTKGLEEKLDDIFKQLGFGT